MSESGPEYLRFQPCIDRTTDTVDLTPDIARLAIHLAFEDLYEASTDTEAGERLITREEAKVHFDKLVPMILEGGA